VTEDILYHVAGGLLTVVPLSAIAWYFWGHPDEWTKLWDDFNDAFDDLNGGPPAGA
jgi:hypothetical protein